MNHLLPQTISSYAKRRTNLSTLPKLALTTSSHTHTPNATMDPLVIANALSLSSTSRSPFLGAQIHAQICKLGFSNDIFTKNNLLMMYSKCGLLGHASGVFDEMPERNVVSWTAMISGSIQNDECEAGFRLFLGMTRSGFRPNEFALASVLSACEAPDDARLGLSIHCNAFKTGLDGNAFVGSSVLLMYAKRGNIDAAERAFGSIDYKDLACLNAMVEAYVSNGYGYDAMKAVALMHQCGLIADRFTYIAAVKGCLITGDLRFGWQLHGLIVQNMFESNTSVMNSLVDLYFQAGMKDIAIAVFGRMQQKDTVSWNTAISGFAHGEDEGQVVGCFADMLLSGVQPNQVTFSVMLRMCAAKENIALGLQIFSFAYRHGYSENVLVANSVVNMLSRCGLVDSAFVLFSNLPARNVVTWNEMIAGYGLCGSSKEALELFCSLVRLGLRADEFTYSAVLAACHGDHDPRNHAQIHANVIKRGFASRQFVSTSLIKAYTKFGLVRSSYEAIEDAKKLDLVSWSVTVSAFLKQGLNDDVLSLLNFLRGKGEKPDEFILACILNACANTAMINQCRCMHSLVVKTGYEKHFCVASAVIDAYAKCGDIACAKKAFDVVSTSHDAILYNTMIMAYANHGSIKEALALHEEMKQADLAPTPATFVALISACSHLGLVEQGKLLFDSIVSVHAMQPTRDNYACLVDLLARNGLLEEARGIIESMPYQPWPAVWRSLLNGCRICGDKEIGVLAAEQILKMAPNNDGAYVSLANVYAEDGRWEFAEKTRRRMVENQVQKKHGYSMIEI